MLDLYQDRYMFFSSHLSLRWVILKNKDNTQHVAPLGPRAEGVGPLGPGESPLGKVAW